MKGREVKKIGKYKGKWCILIGYEAKYEKDVTPVVEQLKNEYPEQQWNIMLSQFPQYDYILTGFASNRDEAHKIGLSAVKKYLPKFMNLTYWVKEISLVNDNVDLDELEK